MLYDKELMNEFIVESKEHLSSIEEDFLALEKQESPETVDKVFRAIHSIKGAAGFLGLKKINDLSHVMETLLQLIRAGEAKVTNETIDVLLNGVDNLNLMLDNIQGSEEFEIERVVEMVTRAIEKASSAKTQKELHTKVDVTDEEGSPFGFDIDEFTLANRPKSHTCLYVLKYNLTEMHKKGGVSPLALVRDLVSTGEILQGRVSTPATEFADVAGAPLYYDVLYSTVIEPDLIEVATKLEKESITQIFMDKAKKAKIIKAKKEAPAAKKANEPAALAPSAPAPEPVKEAPAAPAAIPAAAARKTEEVTSAIIKEEDTQMMEQAKDKTEAQLPATTPNGDVARQQTPSQAQEVSETVRINLNILDRLMTLAGELVLVRNQHLMNTANTDPVSRGISQRLDVVTTELQEMIMRTRMQPVGNIFGKLPRIVRDLAKKLGKKMEIQMTGEEVELDKTILESLGDPLVHLIRNCCDHGLETPEERARHGKPDTGLIRVKAFHEGGQINIEIADDGKGIDPEKIKKKVLERGLKTKDDLAQMTEKEIVGLIKLPGFSTAETVSDVSGRGVGMDVVQNSVEKIGGVLDINSKVGEGTTVLLRLPLTLAIIPCLIVESKGERYAIPQINLEELVCLYDEDVVKKVECENVQEVYRLRNKLLPLVRLSEVFQHAKGFTDETKRRVTEKYRLEYQKLAEAGKVMTSLTFAVVKVGKDRFGLIVDRVLGTEEIVVKPMHQSLKGLKIYSGATVMGDGKCALILDIESISGHAKVNFVDVTKGKAAGAALDKTASARYAEETQTVLLFKNGPEEQFAIPLPLIKRIERIKMADMERVGSKEFINIDGEACRIVRLEDVFSVSKAPEADEKFLLLPKHTHKPFGLLITSLVDITESPLHLDMDSYQEEGILGTSILRGHLTLYPDIYRVLDKLEPELHARSESKSAGEKVLLVEDTDFFRQLVKGYLESDGYKVETATNGKEAMDLLSADRHYDLVVSDIEMPVMNGWDLCKQIKSDNKLKNMHVIALTALDSEKDKARAATLGFDDYLIKIERDNLLRAVHESLKDTGKNLLHQ